MRRWWEAAAAGEDQAFLVVEAKLHDPSEWKRRVLEQLTVLVSKATGETLARIERGLVVARDPEDETKVASADLTFSVNAGCALRVQRLIAQDKRDAKTNKPLPFTNAYRFTRCVPKEGQSGRFLVTSRLAQGYWQERRDRVGVSRRVHALSIIPVTTGLQQLIGTYLAPGAFRALPRALQAGVCQEAAQQAASYLGQLESGRVRGEVSFPTMEDRDPERRWHSYEEAVRALVRDLRPLDRARARDLYPGEYADSDPRGDRLIVCDARWMAVARSPDPPQIPLLFVQGGAVKIVEGRAQFEAGVSKRDRHRGRTEPRARVFASRPAAVQRKGGTELQAWYAAFPVLNAEDEEIQRIVAETERRPGRALDQQFQLMPIAGGGAYRRRPDHLLIPLSGDRDRMERILKNGAFQIAWSRLVCRRGEWFFQITARVPVAKPATTTTKVLGVSFGIDAVATWALLDLNGTEISAGGLAPNEQILAFLREKRNLEWDQQKGRWIGGRRFSRQLESIAHRVANDLLDLACAHGAALAVEDVSYAQKSGRESATNVLFTAWNYGQLRRILGYKAPLAGLGTPVYASDYPIAFTCPACSAMRRKGETQENATTWREGDVLHCRKCGYSGVITPAERSRRVARHGLDFLRNRRKKSAAA